MVRGLGALVVATLSLVAIPALTSAADPSALVDLAVAELRDDPQSSFNRLGYALMMLDASSLTADAGHADSRRDVARSLLREYDGPGRELTPLLWPLIEAELHHRDCEAGDVQRVKQRIADNPGLARLVPNLLARSSHTFPLLTRQLIAILPAGIQEAALHAAAANLLESDARECIRLLESRSVAENDLQHVVLYAQAIVASKSQGLTSPRAPRAAIARCAQVFLAELKKSGGAGEFSDHGAVTVTLAWREVDPTQTGAELVEALGSEAHAPANQAARARLWQASRRRALRAAVSKALHHPDAGIHMATALDSIRELRDYAPQSTRPPSPKGEPSVSAKIDDTGVLRGIAAIDVSTAERLLLVLAPPEQKIAGEIGLEMACAWASKDLGKARELAARIQEPLARANAYLRIARTMIQKAG